LGAKNNVTSEDLKLLYETLQNMYDLDASAARSIQLRKLFHFTNDQNIGSVPLHQLENSIKVNVNSEYPTSFNDFTFEVVDQNLIKNDLFNV
jgi:hypothetical protein